ncbi:MAG: DUF5723 family protein [Saprospiraceae bacterium]|tara:strand:+ start:591 stop:1898 length:1308 start_codon:yes stop_codon:yes gene_type:complete
MYRVISTIIVIVLVGFSAIAQDISIYMMDSVYARTDVNPAFRFSNNLVFDLPGISAGAFTNGVTIGDLLIENGGLNELKLKEGMEDVNDINYVTGNMAVNIIGVGLNMGKWQLSTGYNWHYQGSINYTKDIFLLAANGNAPYIGETLDVGPELLLQSYHEVYIGASYQMSNITLGARIKLLSGINDISTDNASIKLTTEEEIYQLRVESDYVLNTTGIVDYNGIKDVDIDADKLLDELFSNFLGDNIGLAFDFGLDWKVNDKFNISASILDLGKISWNKEVINYKSKGDNTFEGVDILDYIDDDQEVVLEDSLYNLLDFEESNEGYSTSVGARIHLSTRYHMSPKLTLGANYFRASNTINSRYLLSVNCQYKTLPWLSIGTGYGISSNSPILIPLNTMFHIGFVDFYMSTENILSGFSITTSNVSSVKLGLQLGF